MILNSVGLPYVWVQQAEIDIPLNLTKQRLFDVYYQTWYSDINNTNRLHTYARFEHEFLCKEYLNSISILTALSRFRLSSTIYILNVKDMKMYPDMTGCRYCNMNAVEDEYHFLLIYS